MITIDGTFAQRLARRIAEEKTNNAGHVLAGIAQSFEDYKSRCAVIKTLDTVIEWMEQIETDIRKGD